MKSFVLHGDLWRVVSVPGDSPFLIDRTGLMRLATTDGTSRMIYISRDVVPPLLDKVLLHEVAHAVTMSYGLLDELHAGLPEQYNIHVEEWAAQLMENHAIEASVITAELLGRPACVRGFCHV